MRAVRVDQFGEPGVLVTGNVDDPEPAAGQLLVDVRMAGVAYGDVIVRSGRYPLPLPWTPGLEVAGQVVAAGPGTDESLVGKTVVATTAGQAGGYAERALATAAYTFPVPTVWPSMPPWPCSRPARWPAGCCPRCGSRPPTRC